MIGAPGPLKAANDGTVTEARPLNDPSGATLPHARFREGTGFSEPYPNRLDRGPSGV